MYEICRNVIMTGRYELNAMLCKLHAIWLQGNLSDEQHEELIQLARNHADPAMSVDLMRRIEDHENRLKVLESGGADQQPEGQYPEYQEGMSARNGEIYHWRGKLYRCVLPEHTTVCVWSPDAYPDYWQELR